MEAVRNLQVEPAGTTHTKEEQNSALPNTTIRSIIASNHDGEEEDQVQKDAEGGGGGPF